MVSDAGSFVLRVSTTNRSVRVAAVTVVPAAIPPITAPVPFRNVRLDVSVIGNHAFLFALATISVMELISGPHVFNW